MIVNKIINNLNKPVDKGVIENNINRLLSKDIDKRVGLVYGKVQSGKTNSIICLTGELIDRDYRLIILLISDLIYSCEGKVLSTSYSVLSDSTHLPKDPVPLYFSN